MVSFNPEALCREAEAHYLDFLPEGEPDIVPRHIIDHVRGCRRCRSMIERLSSILTRGGLNTAVSQTDEAVGTMLKLHFAYLGQEVTCKTVRPFLPALIDPALEIRIPTPITAHLDNCKSCSQDLEAIRKLNLSRRQLCRLSQMYADKPKDKYIACPKSQAAVNTVVNLSLHETDADILKHLCLCPFCRELVFEARKFTIKMLHKNAEGNECRFCSQLSTSDLFDYAILYGLDPTSNQYARFRESLTSHVRKCPKCLGKIQDLHQTLFSIIERPESGIVTVCHTTESAEAQTTISKHSENLYSGFPICVEVNGTQSADIKKHPVFTGAGTRVFSARRLVPLAKFGAVAAVLALLVSLFLFNMPLAKAVTLDKIYEAVLEVKNVYIASFTSGQSEPTQEKWVSRPLDIYMTSTDDEMSLWDLNHSFRITNIGKSDKAKQELLSSEDTARINTIINSSLDIIPFENMSVLPKDAQWQRLTDVMIEEDKILEVYDLLWTEKSYSGQLAFNKWRVFVNSETNLPKRTEFYRMIPGEQEYDLISFKIIEYPTDNEMQAMVEKLTF